MNSKNVLSVVAAAALAVFAQTSIAQPTATPSRAEVKADTASAAKAGTLTPAGQGPGNMTSSQAGTMPGVATKPAGTATNAGMAPHAGMASEGKTARSEVKGDAKAATGTSETKAGQHVLPQNAGDKEKASASTTTRAERKSETRAANKAGKIQDGEAPRPQSESQKK